MYPQKTLCNFNPRTPYGMRLFSLTINNCARLFQSTHPLRDATMFNLKVNLAEHISIHAPLTGCDMWSLTSTHSQEHFNPRTPYGMRHSKAKGYAQRIVFQSTHPLRDATIQGAIIYPHCIISIHAPLTGCDGQIYKSGWSLSKNFNPRTPYGMRLNEPSIDLNVAYFNPRTPYGMRLFYCSLLLPLYDISIHAPLTGCDLVVTPFTAPSIFQSTHPLRDATMFVSSILTQSFISIHAPLTGCDKIESIQ